MMKMMKIINCTGLEQPDLEKDENDENNLFSRSGSSSRALGLARDEAGNWKKK